MNLELQQKLNKIFSGVERDYRTQFVDSLKKRFIEFTLKDWGFSQVDLETSPDRWDGFCNRLRDVIEQRMEWSKDDSLWTSRGSGSNAQPTKKERGPYRKATEWHFHIVEFVVNSWARDNGARINWQGVTAEWNKDHPPYDQFENMVSLKSLFNKAIRREDKGGVLTQVLVSEWLKVLIELDDLVPPGLLDIALYDEDINNKRERGFEKDRDIAAYSFDAIWKYFKILSDLTKQPAVWRRAIVIHTLLVRSVLAETRSIAKKKNLEANETDWRELRQKLSLQ